MKIRILLNWIDWTLLLATILLLVTLPNHNNSLPIIGFCIMFLTGYMLFKLRRTKLLLFLCAIIGFMNISLSLSDLIDKGIHVAAWQIPLRFTEHNNYLANSILLFLAILNVMLSYTWINRNKDKLNHFSITKRYNRTISYIGLIIMYIVLFITFDSSIGSNTMYVSNSNPLYEYAVVIFVIVWFYSGRNRVINYLLVIYSFLYASQAFFYGDRSAAFLMVLVFFSLYLVNKISLSKIIILAIVAIFVSNIIAETRTGNSTNILQALEGTLKRGIYSDTTSFAYYASITITALNNMDSEIMLRFFDFLESIFLGSGFNENSNLTLYASDFSELLYNAGGGLYQAYFYAWFGYPGVVFGTITLGSIIKFFFSKSKDEYKLYQVLLLSFSLRWYLYGPITLFRSILFIFTIVLILTKIYDTLYSPNENKLLYKRI